MAFIHEDIRPENLDAGHMMSLLADDLDDGDIQEDENVVTEERAVWCEKCGIHNIGECFIHGGKMTVTPDNTMPTRACLSLPKILTLKRVRNSEPCALEAKRGVFSKKMIKARTLFGPLEAKKTPSKPKLQTGMMEYQLQMNGGTTEHLDISDENSCNWMMFVRPANVFTQKNIEAFQDKGQIYFVTCKNIPKGTELRVWYAAAYAKAIGKRILLPEQVDKKTLLGSSKKGKKSLQENLHNNTTASVTSFQDPIKDTSKICSIKEVEVEDKTKSLSAKKSSTIVPEKSTRSMRAQKDNTIFFACNTCNTEFTKLGQLDSHICKALGESEEDSSGCGTRRRKGKPRKLDSEESCPAGKIVRVTSVVQAAENEFGSANIPCEDIINYVKEEDAVSGNSAKLYEEKNQRITLLPSTALIPTTADFSSDESENRALAKHKRGPGRPQGSKNKKTIVAKPEPEMKSDTPSGKRNTYICQHCEKTFTSHEQHLIHEASHTNTLPYTCDYIGCGKSFNSKFKHQRHLTVHKKPNNFKCKFCPSTFNRVDHLKNHLVVHDSNRNTFTCTTCGKSYLYKTNLIFHMAKHEADEGESLQCLVCSKKFESKEKLKLHINIHNRYKKEVERQRRHSCPQCNKLFTTAKDIRRHMVTHSKERHFLCEHCPQTFVRKDHLRRHYTSNHKKEFYESQMKDNPYGCSACLLVFKKKEFYDYHLKSSHPDGVGDIESRKFGRNIAKGLMSNSDDACSSLSSVNKDSQSQLVKHLLLQKQPKDKIDKCVQQLVQFASKSHQPLPVSQQHADPFPVNIVKIQQVNNPNISSRPFAIVCSAPTQSAASQTAVYDSEDMITESFIEPAKTVPFRFQNQLVCQQQLQQRQAAPQLQPDSQLQEPQHQIHHEQQFGQIQIQQQQQQFQQQHQKINQVQAQHVTPMIPGVQVDILNSLASLSQAQDMPGPPNPSILNIITVGGQNFIVGGGQVLDFNKPVQLTVIKDPQIENKQLAPQLPQSHIQHLGKAEVSNMVHSHGQVIQANALKPDHCYASATMTNPTLSQILSSQHKSLLPVLDKTGVLQGSNITDEEATQIIAQIKHSSTASSLTSSLPENAQGQNDLLIAQQQQQQQLQQHLQHQLQDRFQHQENQLEQPQPLQNLANFSLSWTDNLSDYTSVAELPVSADVSSIGQTDGLGTVVPGSAPASWILQLPASMLEQTQLQHLQGQHVQSSHVMTIATAGPVTDS